METFDPEATQPLDIANALQRLSEQPFSPQETGGKSRLRVFKTNETWQRNQRKAARLPLNGYSTQLLSNSDGLRTTTCSLAYDLCDFYEELMGNQLTVPYLTYLDWGYTTLRIRAAREAASRPVHPSIDPFGPMALGKMVVRFVGWSTDSRSHLTEDGEDVRGASTLCGGRLAYHRHTHQQWTRYACNDCRSVANGEPVRRFAFARYLQE